ncbi:MAG: Stk1 family PASTA domain-containing Ser/Thr kinase, partial [Lachnospira sp.]|nr:Stk1 family PASTA domain-containing Ser/Thr kinase [Lachnospira sp.]
MLREGMFLADRYEIIEQIGTGGMADVYKAKCHKLNRYVAIKVMKPEFSQDKTFVAKFRAEAQSAAGLINPNIVNVYDVGDENGIYYIVMELVEGITLKKYIEKRGKLSYKEAVSIAIQVANGMDAAHKHHIIHRDIKPQNIIISKEGKVKVTDFGIAKAATSSTINSSASMGSVHYISPEQARGGYSDERSDIYSLGITLFEMLTGTVPFDGDTTVSVAVRHIQDEIPAPSTLVEGIPVSIDKIVLKCTQKKTERRYQSASELISDLKKSLVMPDVDFVKIPPLYGETPVVPEQNNTNNTVSEDTDNLDDILKDDDILDDDLLDDSDDEDEDNQELSDSDDSDDDDDIDDESNDKLDLIMKCIGIGIAVIILIITIFVIVKLVGSGKSANKDNNETTTETVTEKTTSEDNSKDKVEVPHVEGLTKDDAIKALNEVGLGYKSVIQTSKTVAKDSVISQGTKAGTKVAKNTQIILTISSGPDSVETSVPNVTGKSEEDATSTLKKAGFDVAVDYDYSDTVAQGNVIKYSPSGKVAEGSTITIVISRGKQTKSVT